MSKFLAELLKRKGMDNFSGRVYVLTEEWGEYSDWNMVVRKVFLIQEEGEEICTKLNRMTDLIHKLRRSRTLKRGDSCLRTAKYCKWLAPLMYKLLPERGPHVSFGYDLSTFSLHEVDLV